MHLSQVFPMYCLKLELLYPRYRSLEPFPAKP